MGGTKSSRDWFGFDRMEHDFKQVYLIVLEVKLGIIRGAALASFIVMGKLGLFPIQSRPDRYGNRMYR